MILERLTPAAFVVVGALVLFLVTLDVFLTAISPRGSGPLTARVGNWIWRGALVLHRRRKTDWILASIGPALVVGVVAVWAFLLWIGWTLIFSSTSRAVSGADGEFADAFDRFYFVGYTLVTLGTGDFVPGDGWWQILTVVAAANGLSVLTVGITYILAALSSATGARGLAAYLHGLGESPSEVLVRAWDGQGFGALSDHLVALSSQVADHAQQHLAYPVIHYFHSGNPRSAPPLRIAVLDEAVCLLEHGVAERCRPPQSVLRPIRAALDGYLDVVVGNFQVAPRDDVPPPLPLDELRQAGIPIVPSTDLHGDEGRAAERRATLAGLLRFDGWRWDEMFPGRHPER